MDSTEKLINEYMARLSASAQALAETSEVELSERITQLTPRAAEAVRTAEQALHAHAAHVEQEAEILTTRLERRLSQRIDELVGRSRSALSEELSRLDAAAEEIRQNTPAPGPMSLPTSAGAPRVSVALQIHPSQVGTSLPAAS